MNDNPIEYATRTCKGIEAKADKNKKFSTFLFFVVLFSTVVSPILILVTDNRCISKIIPAILTGCAAMASYWIQLRKPHERWALYRTAQRDIEFEIDQFAFKNGDYSIDNPDKVLADRISQRVLKLNSDWLPMVPKYKELPKSTIQSNEV